jgi:hypothetical protein
MMAFMAKSIPFAKIVTGVYTKTYEYLFLFMIALPDVTMLKYN